MNIRPFFALALLLLTGVTFAQTTVQVPVPAQTYQVPVPAITPPPVPLTILGTTINVPVPPVTPPAVAYTVPAYSVPYMTNVAPLAVPKIGTLAPAGSPSSFVTSLGTWTIANGVISLNSIAQSLTANVVLMVDVNGVAYQENASCLWWFAGGTATSVTWTGTANNSTTPPSLPAGSTLLPQCNVAPPPVTGTFGVKASGGTLVSTLDGSPVELIGINASGLEIPGTDISAFSNTTLAFWQSIKNYNNTGTNTVRLPVNSAQWLNTVCGSAVATYQAAVEHVVSLVNQAGMYVILDLHVDAPGSVCPTGQGNMPSADNAVAFWKSIGATFATNPAVIAELFNEPFGNNTIAEWSNQSVTPWGPGPTTVFFRAGGNFSTFWDQYWDQTCNNGGGCTQNANTGTVINVASEITLLQTLRTAGFTGLVLASPGYWAAEIDQWLNTYTVSGNPDPLKNLGAAWHDYGWTNGPAYAQAIQAAGYPLVITEMYGLDANLNGMAMNTMYASNMASLPAGLAAAQSLGIGYLCWGALNNWNGGALSITTTPPWAGCTAQ